MQYPNPARKQFSFKCMYSPARDDYDTGHGLTLHSGWSFHLTRCSLYEEPNPHRSAIDVCLLEGIGATTRERCNGSLRSRLTRESAAEWRERMTKRKGSGAS